jgi:hypothetical protein
MKYFMVAFLLSAVALCIAAKPSDQDGAVPKRDALRIAIQSICPVSGRELPRDKPLKQWTDASTKESLYVCCEKCVDGKPDTQYLEKIRARQAESQGVCLVMENAVSATSKSQIIGGYCIYVCCPPCFKKVEKSQDKYFSKLDSLHEEFLKKE